MPCASMRRTRNGPIGRMFDGLCSKDTRCRAWLGCGRRGQLKSTGGALSLVCGKLNRSRRLGSTRTATLVTRSLRDHMERNK